MSKLYTTKSIRSNIRRMVSSIIAEDHIGDTYFVVPEGIKAAVERMVISEYIRIRGNQDGVAYGGDQSAIKVNSSFVRGDVISFVKLASRILEMCGRDTKSSSDSIVMRNAIYRVLAEHPGEFQVFNKLVSKFEYIDMLINLIGDFVRYGIDEDAVCSAYELALEESDSEVYVSKMHDLKLLLGYLNELGDLYDLNLMTDSITEANKLLDKIIKDKSLLDSRRYRSLRKFLNSRIAILGFGTVRAFTPEECTFIKFLNSLGVEFTITSLYNEEQDSKFYSYGNATVRMISELIPGIEVEEIGDVIPSDLSADREAMYNIADAFANEAAFDESLMTDAMEYVSIRQTDDRLGYIANEIIRLTREEDYRYRDIRIVYTDESILPRLKTVMGVFGLDAFIDHKIVISNTPVFRFASSLIELPLHNYDYKDVLRFMRTGMARVIPELCDLFENYCVKYNITHGNKIFDKSYFTSNNPDGTKRKYLDTTYRKNYSSAKSGVTDKDRSDKGRVVPVAEYLWENVVERILIPARDKAEEIKAAPTIAKKALILAEYLDSYNNYVDKLSMRYFMEDDTDRASALVRGHKEVMSILAAFTSEMNDVAISHEAFCSLIRIDMRNKTIGSIPLKIDSVEIVPIEQAYLTDTKIMFLVGARSDNFPYTSTNEGIMTQSELNVMAESINFDLPDRALNKSKSEFITASLMFGTVTDKMYFIDTYGDKLSSAIEFFISHIDKSKYRYNCFVAPVNSKSVERRHEFTSSTISKDTMKALMEDGASTSVTAIEKFNTCPFQFMLENVLSVKARENNIGLKANSMGTIIHAMFEETFSSISEKYTNVEDLKEYSERISNEKDLLDKVAKDAFDAYVAKSDKPSEKTYEFSINPGRKAIRIFSFALPFMLKELSDSSYIPVKNEQKVQELDNPLKYTTSDGTIFEFRGSIDRVDESEVAGSRIIDYKSGHKKIDLVKALAGVQLQLFAYAKACRNSSIDVNEVGYFEIGLSTPKDGKPLKLKPELSQLSQEDFDTVVEYVDYSIARSCEDIMSGVANACLNSKEYSTTMSHCDLCPYSGACGNDAKHPRLNCKAYLVKPDGAGKGWSKDAAIDEMRSKLSGEEDSGEE